MGWIFLHGLWRGNNNCQQNQNAFKVILLSWQEKYLHSSLKCIELIQTYFGNANIKKKVNFPQKLPRLRKEEIWWECEICYGISSIISPFILIPQHSYPTTQAGLKANDKIVPSYLTHWISYLGGHYGALVYSLVNIYEK